LIKWWHVIVRVQGWQVILRVRNGYRIGAYRSAFLIWSTSSTDFLEDRFCTARRCY